MNIMFAAWLGGWEWVIVILAVLLLFGAKKIPELASGLGTGIKEFKKATREVTEEIQNATDDKPAKTASQNQSGAQRPAAARPDCFPNARSPQGLTAGFSRHGRRSNRNVPTTPKAGR